MSLFETDRLAARRLIESDAEAMATIYGDPETVRYVGDAEPLSVDECRHWIEITDRNFENRGYGMVALTDRSTGDLIGCAGVVHPGQQEQAEVKYAFRRDCWGRGYATEAVQALVEYAESVLGVKALIATVNPQNDTSQRVLGKSGFARGTDRIEEDGSVTQVWLRKA